jgi:hypothetical protein
MNPPDANFTLHRSANLGSDPDSRTFDRVAQLLSYKMKGKAEKETGSSRPGTISGLLRDLN